MSYFKAKMHLNSISAEALPQTPLGELKWKEGRAMKGVR